MYSDSLASLLAKHLSVTGLRQTALRSIILAIPAFHVGLIVTLLAGRLDSVVQRSPQKAANQDARSPQPEAIVLKALAGYKRLSTMAS